MPLDKYTEGASLCFLEQLFITLFNLYSEFIEKIDTADIIVKWLCFSRQAGVWRDVRALSLYTLLASIRATDPCSWALNIGPRLTDFRGWDHTEEASIDGEGCEWQGQMRREMVGGPAGSRHTGIIVTGLPRPLCRGEPVTEKDMTAEVFINSLRWRFVMDLLPPFKSVTLNWRL